MEYNKNVKDMVPGDKVEGFYILKEAYQKISSNGKPFLSAVIADKTGTMDVKVWDYAGPVGTQEDVGKIIKIRGDVSEFKGNPQLSLSNIRMALPEDNCDTVRLVAAAPIDKDETVRKVRTLVDSMEDTRLPPGGEDHAGAASGDLCQHPGGQKRPSQLPVGAADAHCQHDGHG